MKKLIVFLLLFVCKAQAHLVGFTDTSIQIAEPGIKIIYTLPSDNLIELEQGPDDRIRTSEGDKAGTEKSSTEKTGSDENSPEEVFPPDYYADLVSRGWHVDSRKRNCHLQEMHSIDLEQIASYQYTMVFECPQGLDDVDIYYSLFTEQWRGHRNYSRVYMAGEQMRTRFAFDRNKLSIPVAKLLQEWKSELGGSFFADDPNHVIKELENSDNANAAGDSSNPFSRLGTAEPDWADPGFIWMGMEHIWTGLDHVVFVIALLLVPVSWKRWMLWISLFTVAHSITLALSYFKVILLFPSVTEPLIALTVLAIGIENILVMRHGESMLKWRSVIIPVFGLIHGVGFSYMLIELGNGIPAVGRLFFFNLGVELGQLALVALFLVPVYLLFRWQKGRAVAGFLSGNIALFGAYWLFQRLVF
ncbi:hypothetical protein BTA51_14900 [Hahella sp. CCB-MM4]|uniref:HupE/UreJ family protein n=1 Tax=Hahella sp. (strain CCB-MM4) TaxID=1926491 RepID=UPI000B9B3EBF|nr:HupE/UreJ family protein [Hahella sp. CCB-MM4]OZG72417.1 hypothetical protein BTA51_14900 [Hahella sp. CCB-MM4]